MQNISVAFKQEMEAAKQFKWWLSWANILLGCVIVAIGFVFFINPYNIVPGGVYGASIVCHYLFPSIQVGTFGYMFDIPLLILSAVLLGTALGARTLVAALFTPLVMNVLSTWVYPDQAALESLDPSLLLGGCLNLSDHLMLSAIMGAVLVGLGEGMVVRRHATTGGSDIVAMILQKYAHIRFSIAILLVDAVVVTFGLLFIGFGVGESTETQPALYLSLYSLIAIFVISRVLAFVINGTKDDKLLFVISDKNMQGLHDYILKDLDRTATRIKSSGLYTGAEKEMIFLVVNHREVIGVKHIIKEVDPEAFVVVTDAYDTFGAGWKELPSRNEIEPE